MYNNLTNIIKDNMEKTVDNTLQKIFNSLEEGKEFKTNNETIKRIKNSIEKSVDMVTDKIIAEHHDEIVNIIDNKIDQIIEQQKSNLFKK